MLQTLLETGGFPRFVNRDIAAQLLREQRADLRAFFSSRRGEPNIDLRELILFLEEGGAGDAKNRMG